MLIKKLVFLFYVSTHVYGANGKSEKKITGLILDEHILEYLLAMVRFLH